MILQIENLGLLKNAEIGIDAISVIAGENDTGKSTVGKMLYSICNGLYNISDQILNERKNRVQTYLMRTILEDSFTPELYSKIVAMASHIVRNWEGSKYYNEEKLKEYILGTLTELSNPPEKVEGDTLAASIETIKTTMQIPNQRIMQYVLQNTFSSEFGAKMINNINHQNETCRIRLKIDELCCEINIKNNEITLLDNLIKFENEAIYIDDPFILDDLISPSMGFFSPSPKHRDDLVKLLLDDENKTEIENAFNEALTSTRLTEVFSKLNSVCNGELIYQSRTVGYRGAKSKKAINMKSISTGLKTFILIKTLLMNGSLKPKGTIILDEPEIHLHPQWQLIFAEIIVLLQKEYGFSILINTHSPYFLNAIEVYAFKHGILKQCRFYLAEREKDRAEIIDVTGDIDKIYKKLAQPFQILENVRYSDE